MHHCAIKRTVVFLCVPVCGGIYRLLEHPPERQEDPLEEQLSHARLTWAFHPRGGTTYTVVLVHITAVSRKRPRLSQVGGENAILIGRAIDLAREAFQQDPASMGSHIRAVTYYGPQQQQQQQQQQRRGSLEDDEDEEEDLHAMHHRPFKRILEQAKAREIPREK